LIREFGHSRLSVAHLILGLDLVYLAFLRLVRPHFQIGLLSLERSFGGLSGIRVRRVSLSGLRLFDPLGRPLLLLL
jgi:hypothetical protein